MILLLVWFRCLEVWLLLMYLVSLLTESCSLLHLIFSPPLPLFKKFFPLGNFLEKLAFEWNSWRGAVFYCAGCTVIGEFLGTGVTTQKSLLARVLEQNCSSAEGRQWFGTDFDKVLFFFFFFCFPKLLISNCEKHGHSVCPFRKKTHIT